MIFYDLKKLLKQVNVWPRCHLSYIVIDACSVPCPENRRGPNWEDCPRAESVPEPSDNESESSEILISSDDES